MKGTIRALTLPEAKALYRQYIPLDFPPAEVKPWRAIEKRLHKDAYICLGFGEQDALRGYAFFASMQDQQGARQYLLDYFAVLSPFRGEGWGSFFLRQMASCLPRVHCVLAEVENPDYAKRQADRALQQRRLQFYLRSGAAETGVESRIYGVEYRLLELSRVRALTPNEVRALYSAFYHSFFSPLRYQRKVVIR